MAVWTNPADYSVGQATCVARMDEQILTNIDFAGSHGHTGAAGDGSLTLSSGSTVKGSNYNQVVYRHLSFPPLLFLDNDSLVSFSSASNNLSPGTVLLTTGGCQFLPVDLDSGVWSFTMIFTRATNGGQLAACLGGGSLGRIDMSGATSRANCVSNASTITVSSSGATNLRFVVASAGSAGSAGGITCEMVHIDLRRTSS